MTLVRMIARPMLASMFITGGVSSFRNADRVANRAAPVLGKLTPMVERATASLPVKVDDKMLVRANAAVHVVGGAMLATGKSPRLAALALAATMVPTTFGGHRFWEESDPQQRANQKTHFIKNVSMTGGLLLASVDTAGKPSLAWRARRQAAKASKKARKKAGELTS
jgi:putative oxidoreductase